MGKIGGVLFGKKPKPATSTSHSGNYAYDGINSAFSPNFGFTNSAGSMMSNLLGLGGGPAQLDALNNFANSGGMQFLREQGNNQVNSNQAAKGLLQSGDTLKELTKYGQGLGSTYLNQYMQNLGSLANIGLSSGALVSDAGKYSDATSKGATQGKQGILPTLLSAGAGLATGGASGGFLPLGDMAVSSSIANPQVLGSIGGPSLSSILSTLPG